MEHQLTPIPESPDNTVIDWLPSSPSSFYSSTSVSSSDSDNTPPTSPTAVFPPTPRFDPHTVCRASLRDTLAQLAQTAEIAESTGYELLAERQRAVMLATEVAALREEVFWRRQAMQAQEWALEEVMEERDVLRLGLDKVWVRVRELYVASGFAGRDGEEDGPREMEGEG